MGHLKTSMNENSQLLLEKKQHIDMNLEEAYNDNDAELLAML